MAVTELEIDRATWLTGEYMAKSLTNMSLLRDSQGRQCCLGFYAKACGFSDEQITGRTSPAALANHGLEPPDEMQWLVLAVDMPEVFEDDYESTDIAEALMNMNDSLRADRAEREAAITALFAKQGINIVFTGDYAAELDARRSAFYADED